MSTGFLASNVSLTLFQVIFLAITATFFSVIIYRLYFHPLAKVPGPRLAAVTWLYQTYYSFIGGSRFYLQIEKLHEIYGPIVRITPDEVHLSDLENYDKIYYVGSHYSKDANFYGAFGNENSSFTTPSNELHRQRRTGLNSFFSRKIVIDLEDIVQDKARKVCKAIDNTIATGKPMDLHHALRAVSIDVITEYAFGESYGLLDTPDFGYDFFMLVLRLGPAAWIFRQAPWLKTVLRSIPESLVRIVSAPMTNVIDMQRHCNSKLRNIEKQLDVGSVELNGRATIFSALMTPDDRRKPAAVAHLEDEAYTVLTAAADTTGNAMTTICRYVFADPNVYSKLHAELKTSFPDENEVMRFQILEKLPYLTGVINEGLRLSFGVVGRLPRTVPQGGASFHGYDLPPRSVVSMSSWLIHRNKEYFPDPAKFDPDRWVNASDPQSLHKAFVPFGKGSRACVGMNLAYDEIYVTVAQIFRHYPDLKSNTHELTASDAVLDDYFSSYNPADAKTLEVQG
ncbi:hypothetical protein FSST1_006771 [Fusarium sambucinum]